MTALYQDFLAVLLLYISLVMRQSSGWAFSANDKKKCDVIQIFAVLLLRMAFWLCIYTFLKRLGSAIVRGYHIAIAP